MPGTLASSESSVLEEWNIHGYQELSPPAALAPFVECTWLLRREVSATARVLPDGCSDLILDGDGEARFVGTMGRAVEVQTKPGRTLLAVRFAPGGAAALFGLPMTELRDWSGPWSDLDTRTTWDAVVEARTQNEAVHRLEEGLMSRLSRLPPRSHQAARVAALVMQRQTSIASVAAELSMSRQQLRRVVVQATGLGPKHLARIGRLRRLISAESGRGWGVAEALAAGFCDQAHMANEFRQLVGTTPGHYFELASDSV